MTEGSNPSAGGYVRLRALVQRIPVAKSTIWAWVKKGTFPRPVKLSGSVTAWPAEDIAKWEASRRSSAATQQV
jgi:predicted DNA-binding transcriptional regulator AlpA